MIVKNKFILERISDSEAIIHYYINNNNKITKINLNKWKFYIRFSNKRNFGLYLKRNN